VKRLFNTNRVRAAAFTEDGEEPMSGVANLADVMLVLAVGIMLALVINWNIDVSPLKADAPTTPSEIVSEIEGFGEGGETEIDADAQFEKMNVEVYRDPVTGKLYMVEKNVENPH
jgi:hypothetical protein